MSQINVNNIRAKDGVSAVGFPGGINATGVVTATTFSGNLTGNVTGNADTATSAQGLTGTPNITVGTVTGTNATFSGNLTVNGTTTTIDTAVTSVDSLAVDGDVLIGGHSQYTYDDTGASNVILDIYGGATAGKRGILSLSGRSGDNDADLGTIWFNNDNNSGAGPGNQMKLTAAIQAKSVTSDGNAQNDSGANLRFYTKPEGGAVAERLSITSGGPAIFKAGLAEKFQTGTTIQADPTLALSDGNVVLRTSNESGNQAINFTGVHSTLAVGESVSFTVIITPNGSGAINAVQIDAAAQTIQWSGGSAPSAGSSGKDVYTFTLLKTGSGTTDYQVFGAATNYA